MGRSLARELSDSPSSTRRRRLRAQTALALLARSGKQSKGAAMPLQQILWDGPTPLRASAAQVLGYIPGSGDKALGLAMAAGEVRVRDAALLGLLADRQRRRSLPAVHDSLKAIDLVLDTARTRAFVDALGYVGVRSRDLDRTLTRTLQRAPSLAAAIALARRRLTIGF